MSKFTFDFLYQPQVDFCSGKETALHALTRAGKTWQTISMLTAARDHSNPMIPLMFTEPSRAGLHDACSKAKEQGWDDDNIIFLNKDKHVNLFLSQIRGFDLSEKLFFMVNANGHHYDRVYNAIHTRSGSLSEGVQTIPVLQAEDEAHRGVEKRSPPWVEQDEFDEVEFAQRFSKSNAVHQALSSHRILVSATLERNAFPVNGYTNLLLTGKTYVNPYDARCEDISPEDNWALRDNGDLTPWLNQFMQDLELEQSMCLVNGVFNLKQHAAMVAWLQAKLPVRNDIGILKINAGKLRLNTPGSTVDHTLEVKDTQTAINSLYHEHGIRHLWCIGHKQAELGQTFADKSKQYALTRQITATSVNATTNTAKPKGYKPEWASIAQWNRTGGYTVLTPQTMHMCASHWNSYTTYAKEFETNIRAVIDGQKQIEVNRPHTLRNKPPMERGISYNRSDLKLCTNWFKIPSATKEAVYSLPAYLEGVKKGDYRMGTEVFNYNTAKRAEDNRYDKITVRNRRFGTFQIFPEGVRHVLRWPTKDESCMYHDHCGNIKESWKNPGGYLVDVSNAA